MLLKKLKFEATVYTEACFYWSEDHITIARILKKLLIVAASIKYQPILTLGIK